MNTCGWFWNRCVWSKWKDIRAGSLTNHVGSVGRYVDQERRCERCGKVQLRVAKCSL